MNRCSVPDCEELHSARGFCAKHYNRWHRHGDPNVVRRPGRKVKHEAIPQELRDWNARYQLARLHGRVPTSEEQAGHNAYQRAYGVIYRARKR